MTDSRTEVLAHLTRAAAARRRRRAGRHAASALSLAGGLVLTSVVALAVAPALRPWLLVALASAVIVGLGMVAGAALRREGALATAAWIGRRSPDLGGALADAVEFSGRLARGERIPTGSDDLARAHVARAAGLAASVDPESHALALPPPPWRTAAGVLAAAALAFALLPAGRRTLLFGPPPPAPPRVTYGAVELTYRHPAYLRLPDRVETGAGDIEAPVGTHVEVRVQADRPLAAARLEPSEGAAVEMTVDGASAAGTLVLTKSGTYRIALRGAAGELDTDPPTHVLRAVPDGAPIVRLRSPRQDVVLSEGDVLAVEWVAEDDHGVSEAALVVSLGSEADEPPEPGASPEGTTRLPLGTFDPAEADRSGAQAFSTSDLQLLPGDHAWLWVEARDDDAVTGPKWDASSRVRVTVRSDREEESAVDRGQQELAERLLALLATHLVAPADRLKDAAAVAAHHRDFLPRLAAVAAMAGELGLQAQAEMEDMAAASALQDMRNRLESLARTRGRRSDGLLSGDSPRAIAVHADLFDREIAELERDVLFFDMWADRRASLRASDAAEDLLASTQELREAAERESPAATAEELAPQAQDFSATAEELQGLLRQLAEAAGADPAAAAESREMLSALQDSAKELASKLGRGDRASARRDARRMEQIASELADRVGDLSDAGAAGDPELAKEIDRAEAEMRRLRREQADLRDETNRARDELRRALSPEDLQHAEEGFAELEKLAREAVAAHARGDAKLGELDEVAGFFRTLEDRERASARLREILEDGSALTPKGAAEVQELQALLSSGPSDEIGMQVESLMRTSMNARELLGRMQQVVADRDLASARAPARWALDQLRALREELGESGPLSPARPDMATAEAKTSELLQRLDELQDQLEQAAQQAMTSAQREQLAGLGQKQGQMQQRARELAGRLRELGADAPFLGEGVADQVDEAGGFMDEATRGLFSRRPGSASESQGEALSRLDQAADALSPSGNREDGSPRSGSRGQREGQQAGGRRPGGREGGDEGRDGRRGRTSRERVEIPDADDFKVPKEFREEILEAMRESSAPDGYAEQVREYYRRLVE